MTADADIRLLTIDDLDGAFALSSTAGWNQQLDDWRMLLRIAPAGSFAALAEGRIVGTAIGIDYGSFGWIAMMLVDPAYRARGIGARLLEAAMAALPPDRPIRLDATPLGRPLYQRYGFEDETTLSRRVADPRDRHVLPVSGLQPLTSADLAIITKEDRTVFGGNRSAVLEWTHARAPEYAWGMRTDSGVVQYCLGRPGRLFDHVGPVVARDHDIATALVSAAVRAAGDRPIVIDAFDSRKTFSGWLGDNGFQVQRPLFRMSRPGRARQSAVEDTIRPPLFEFAILGPEFA